MENITGLVIAADSLEYILDDLLVCGMFGFFPVMFVLFLVLTIVQIVKRKKHGGKATKTIVFGIISGFFLIGCICEVIMLFLIAAAVAHM